MQLQTIKFNKLPLIQARPGYDHIIKKFNRDIQGQQITADLINLYLSKIKQNQSPATYNLKRNALKQALIELAKNGNQDTTFLKYQIEEVFEKVKPIKQDKSLNQNDFLTNEQYNDLLEIADQKTALIVKALYQTACRISELINIKLSDCMIKNDIVFIKIIGKGNKEGTVYLKIELLESIKKAFKGKTYLFETAKGTKYNRSNVYRKLQETGRLIGFDLSPHKLRHTFATLNIDRLGVYKVSQYLRHSSIETTTKYLHTKPTAEEILQGVS